MTFKYKGTEFVISTSKSSSDSTYIYIYIYAEIMGHGIGVELIIFGIIISTIEHLLI